MTSDSRAAFRLGLSPVLLLGWNMAAGDPLPFLAPSLLVTVLAASPVRPALVKLAGGLVLVVGLTWVLDTLFQAVADHPASLWLALFAVAAAAFARLAQRPGDMLAMLTLITASLVVVLREWAQGLDLGVSLLMGRATAQAIVAALIAHALLPSRLTAGGRARPPGAAQADLVRTFGRAAGLIVALLGALLLRDNSAILVALTAVNVLAAPAEAASRTQGQKAGKALVLANMLAGALVLPIVAVASVQPAPGLLLLLGLAGGLWLADGAGRGMIRRIAARVGLSVYVLLLGVLLPKAGESALGVLADRLLTVALVVLYAIAVLVLLRPAQRLVAGSKPAKAP